MDPTHSPSTHAPAESHDDQPPVISTQGAVAIGAAVMALYIAFFVYLFASH
jgi:hypothetical protein